MKINLSIFLIIVLLPLGTLKAQFSYELFNISLNGNYTTSAKIYLNPNSSDIDLKNRSNPVEDILSPSIDLRYAFTEEIYFGLEIEYLKKVGTQVLTVLGTGGTKSISIEDGFKVIPIELSLYYLLPFSSEKFKFLIGGGAAYYYGSHIRKFGDEEISNVKRDFAYGIQVSATADYFVLNFLSIRTEMKFRDPEFEITSKYNKSTVNYKGETIRIYQEKFDSKINIDGVTFILGLAFHF
ncbi:MAG: hypothetical protein NTX22_14710 [Ignavibacteriales bacterium]|nr:hypothetical protein [Ignavibacteriales bacterium]